MAYSISGVTVIDDSRKFLTCNSNFLVNSDASHSNGSCNTFIGPNSGKCNLSGTHNFFAGLDAGCCINSAGWNVAVGQRAGRCITTATNNTFFGRYAGSSTSTGFSNISMGPFSGRNNTTGYNNVFIGSSSGRDNLTGYSNIYIGDSSGTLNTSGFHNVFIGAGAGECNRGSNNIAIGRCSGRSSYGLYNLNSAAINNAIVMGNCEHTVSCIKTAWTTSSDIRYKCVWGNISHGRNFLRGVNPIEYSFIDYETEEVTDQYKRYGFSAQEILSIEGDDPVITNTTNPNNLGINYDYFIPILVNAIKELDAENQSILSRLEALENSTQV